jgi:hypothetical protein
MTIIGAKTCIAQNMDKIVDHGNLLVLDNGLTKHENENWISKHIF